MFTRAAGVQAMVIPHQLALQLTPTQPGTRQTPLQLGLPPSPLLGVHLLSLPLLVPPPAQLLPQLRARARPLVFTGQLAGTGQ